MGHVRRWAGVAAIPATIALIAACASDEALEAEAPVARTGDADASAVEATPAEPDAASAKATAFPPTEITDLKVTSSTYRSMRLSWRAPRAGSASGRAAYYELRYAPFPIDSLAAFDDASPALAPVPADPGVVQEATVEPLDAATEYHFAIRARDGSNTEGPLSRSVASTTGPRAKLVITEVAPNNGEAEGFDFIELTTAVGGEAAGLEVHQISGAIYTFPSLTLLAGERVVVHATGVPGPAGAVQEDAPKNPAASTEPFARASAIDVYVSPRGLVGTDNVIRVVDGAKVSDAVVFSNRDGDASGASMAAFDAVRRASAWSFRGAPVDGATDCETQRDAVNVADGETACGGFDAGLAPGASIQRREGADSGGKDDFFVAAQSPGATNVAPPPPRIKRATAVSATAVDVFFDQELSPPSIAPAAFTIAGLTVSAAAPREGHIVRLTTSDQGEGARVVAASGSVKSVHGLGATAEAARFCAFAPLAATIALSEVNANLPASADLVELEVTRGGALEGLELRLAPRVGSSGTRLAVLPSICATAGDRVVIHLSPAAGAPPASEVEAKDEHPAAQYATHFDSAWDVLGDAVGIPFTDAVLAVRAPTGAWIAAAAFSDKDGLATSSTYRESLAFVQAAGLWLPADCGGAPCTDASTPTAQAVAASWAGLDATPSGQSVRRIASPDAATSFAVGPSSFGAAN